MSGLFDDDEVPAPAPPRRRAAAQRPPRPPSAKAQRLAAPAPTQHVAAAPVEALLDPADAEALRTFARFDMLADEELDKRPEIFEDIYPSDVRREAQDWRRRHGRR